MVFTIRGFRTFTFTHSIVVEQLRTNEFKVKLKAFWRTRALYCILGSEETEPIILVANAQLLQDQ